MPAPDPTPAENADAKASQRGLLEVLYYLDLLFGVLVPGIGAVGFLISGALNGNVEHILFGGIGAIAAGFCWLIAKGLKAAVDD